MSDIIREVDEELKRENWQKLWKRYGKFLIGVAVFSVAATAAVVGWREYDASQRLAIGDRFAAVLADAESSDTPAASADALSAFAAGAPDGYAMLARLREAKLRADAGDRAAAITIYDSIAGDGSADRMFRDLAILYSVRTQADDGDPDSLIARLSPLGAETGTWRYSARELTAILHLRAGDIEASRAAYQQLADDLLAPQGLRARAAEMLRAIGG